jgi:hypothetical protein
VKPLVTIFVSTYNRLTTLTRTLNSFKNFVDPYEVVVIDNGSTHPACQKLLEKIEKRRDVRRVYRLEKIFHMDELTLNINQAMRDRYDEPDCPEWFAVTDADICFEGSSPYCLGAYVSLARHTGKVPGPHTRVNSDLPIGYPLRSRVLVCESRLLYKDTMHWLRSIPYSGWPIDNTFQVFPARTDFPRLQMDTVRVGPPYDAMHLDWYSDVFKPKAENFIYITDRAMVSSWGGGWIKAFWEIFQDSPEEAFRSACADGERWEYRDFNNGYFIASWCRRYGVGCDIDIEQSVRLLDAAIPPDRYYLQHREDYLDMIYRDDFSSLGWK